MVVWDIFLSRNLTWSYDIIRRLVRRRISSSLLTHSINTYCKPNITTINTVIIVISLGMAANSPIKKIPKHSHTSMSKSIPVCTKIIQCFLTTKSGVSSCSSSVNMQPCTPGISHTCAIGGWLIFEGDVGGFGIEWLDSWERIGESDVFDDAFILFCCPYSMVIVFEVNQRECWI